MNLKFFFLFLCLIEVLFANERERLESFERRLGAFLSINEIELEIDLIDNLYFERFYVTRFPEHDDRKLYIEISTGTLYLWSLTSDALELLLCHEVAHFLTDENGGVIDSGINSEGEADYLSNGLCTSILWQNEMTTDEVYDSSNRKLKRICEEDALCVRKIRAAWELSLFLYQVEERYPLSRQEFERARHDWRLRKDGVDILNFDFISEVHGSLQIDEYPLLQCRFESLIAIPLNKERPRCWSF